jgi:hypothetical protein
MPGQQRALRGAGEQVGGHASAYTAGTALLACATAISRPRPGVPMTSSPVTVSTSATDVARRTPVSAYGSAVGHTR